MPRQVPVCRTRFQQVLGQTLSNKSTIEVQQMSERWPRTATTKGQGIIMAIFVLYPPVLSWESVVYPSWFNKSEFDEERDCMGKAILAMIVTVIVGYISGAIFANWVNAPEWGVILAVAVMGAFIIYFNDKKQ